VVSTPTFGPLPSGLLVLPRTDDARLRDLVRKLRLLVLRELLGLDARALSEPVRRALPRVQDALLSIARARSSEVLAALGSPDVLPALLAMRERVADADAMLRLAMPNLLERLLSDAVLDARREWDVSSTVPPRNAHAIEGLDAHLSLVDANPLAMREDHPDKTGNAVDLGGRPIAAWTAALSAAVELIRITLPTIHAELALTLQRIVPVGYDAERHLSASYREAPGLIYLTLHPSVLTLAEAIVHETQHGKLNVLSYFDPVLVNGRTTWTSSPVRPDLRPLSGVLLAVHAFVPVAAMHLRLAEIDHPLARTPEGIARRREVVVGNERGLATLRELGEPTAIGREILAALEAVHAVTLVGD